MTLNSASDVADALMTLAAARGLSVDDYLRQLVERELFVKGIETPRKAREPDIEELFRQHSEKWKNETGHFSSVNRMVAHPSYLRIIGMGREALPLILRELQEHPDHWLVALNAITGEDPALEGASFHEAVNAWITWGRSHGYC